MTRGRTETKSIIRFHLNKYFYFTFSLSFVSMCLRVGTSYYLTYVFDFDLKINVSFASNT